MSFEKKNAGGSLSQKASPCTPFNRFPQKEGDFLWSEPRIARFCSRCAFVFGGTKAPPYGESQMCGRGELRSPAFVHGMRSFLDRRGRRSLQENFIFSVGATIGRPFLHTVCVLYGWWGKILRMKISFVR